MGGDKSKRELIQKLLKGIETGDAKAAAVVNEAKYIQHNPQTHEGSEGLAALFARLSKTNPRVRFIRVFEDGDYAFAHNEYDFSTLRIAFEVFRFEDGQAVEHWDNIQPAMGPNPSGRAMLDGTTEITDLDKTEHNRSLVREYIEDVYVAGNLEQIEHYAAEDLIQHNPELPDGAPALRRYLESSTDGRTDIRYTKVHKVLAEGNFVLSMSEGTRHGTLTSFYDLHRIENGRVVEHWDTIEAIAPRSEWKNDNGKF